MNIKGETSMVSKAFKVTNSLGLHMRPASFFVSEMAKFSSDVRIKFNDLDVDGKSLMSVIAACIKCGSDIEIECSGDDEQAALDKASELIESGLGEE
jgi:phosphocarrier protein